jgi:hypothetical protein
MEWREVSIADYGVITKLLERYGPVRHLSGEAVAGIVEELRHLTTYVYEVKRREETPDEIAMVLDFVRMDTGL